MIIDILIALLVVGSVGLLAAILLALVSHFFGVAQDEREKALRDALPGVNCGACGYKGCDDYAVALANDEARPNLCVPGGTDTATALSDILGVEVDAPENNVAFVHCNGNCEATSKKADYSGVATCRAASALYGGPNDCIYGCLGYGDCAAVCPVNAICMKDGIAHVDASLCIGCGLCVSTCPKSIIYFLPKGSTTVVMCNNTEKGADARKKCTNACIACKKCEKVCPEGAVKVIDNLAVINYGKCTSCGLCTESCPTGCIKTVPTPKQ